MKALRIVLGTLLAISGTVWMLQGMGSEFAPQSFMTESKEWIVIGAITLAVGIWLVVRTLRHRS